MKPYVDRLLCSRATDLISAPDLSDHLTAPHFLVVVPKLWNSLPQPIRSAGFQICFYRVLKTHFYRLALPYLLPHYLWPFVLLICVWLILFACINMSTYF